MARRNITRSGDCEHYIPTARGINRRGTPGPPACGKMLALAMIIAMSAGAGKPNGVNVIPNPLVIESRSEPYIFSGDSVILVAPSTPQLRQIGADLAAYIQSQTGRSLTVSALTGSEPPSGAVLLSTGGNDEQMGDEGYDLKIKPDGVRLSARSPRGLIWGVQTIRQLLPWTSPATGSSGSIRMAGIHIKDRPRFAWRGMHLDVSRHFMPVAFIQRYIDLLSLHKLNTFHWHLTDDQGWRIQIKRYPKLTEVGAWRTHHGARSGGFYTQDEIRQLIAYAHRRGVTIVPEIELPGHSLAALAAYPQLSCTGGPFEVPDKWGIFEDVYCAGNEETFEFLENVLDEVIDLFDSPYIHIGGDECPKARWKTCAKCQDRMRTEGLDNQEQLQSYFIKRITRFVNSRGRRVIGWDEILEGGLAPSATVMSWRGVDGGIRAARLNHDVIMSPTSHCYFDYRQSADPDTPGRTSNPPLTLHTVYEYEPIPDGLTASQAAHILGAQGNVWTEYMQAPEDVERMAFPRACALAEVVWSTPDRRNWDDFIERMRAHERRLDSLGVHYTHALP